MVDEFEIDAEAQQALNDDAALEQLTLYGIPSDRLMLEGVDTSEGPLYTVSEMARFFFRRSSHWVRWLETCQYSLTIKHPDKKGKTLQRPCGAPVVNHSKAPPAHKKTWKLVLDGELLTPLRTKSNARMYDLALIEKMAHALASNGTITLTKLKNALILVKAQADMYGYFDEPEETEEENV